MKLQGKNETIINIVEFLIFLVFLLAKSLITSSKSRESASSCSIDNMPKEACNALLYWH